MTLDTRKALRVRTNRAAMRAGRTVQAAAVYRTSYGGIRADAVTLILKGQGSSDPAVADTGGSTAAEYLAELDLAIDPRPIAYLALTGGATDPASLAAAIVLEIVDYRQAGLVPDRWEITLRRLR